MSRPNKVALLQLSQISNKFDVRTSLDDDRIIQLASLYESGCDLPPIKVVQIDDGDEDTLPQYAYVDGRHRGAARAFLNLPDITAVILNGNLQDDPVALYGEALQSNWGGSKPPTRDDIVHTIRRMLEAGATQMAIRERLNFLPSGSLTAYLTVAKGNLTKRRISRARNAIAQGATIEEAAKEYKIKLETLKDAIAGKRHNWGDNRTDEAQYIIDLKGYISRVLFAANTGIAKKMSDMLSRVDSGEVAQKEAANILKAWREHLRKTGIRLNDWDARLAAIGADHNKSVGGDTDSSILSETTGSAGI